VSIVVNLGPATELETGQLCTMMICAREADAAKRLLHGTCVASISLSKGSRSTAEIKMDVTITESPRALAGAVLRMSRRVHRNILFRAADDPVVAFWWRRVPNFGDMINPLLIEAISGRKVFHCNSVWQRAGAPVHMVVGSVLSMVPADRMVVWGSGFLTAESRFLAPVGPARGRGPAIRAVRGPLTRELALRQGAECPEV
jgi:hypothetical protein